MRQRMGRPRRIQCWRLARKRFTAGMLAAVWFCGACVMWGLMPREAAAEASAPSADAARYDPKGRRDPFVPLVRDGRLVGAPQASSQVESIGPALSGILWDPGGNSIALINDGEYRVGQAINDYTVQEIRRDAVVLTSGAETLVLQIQFGRPESELSPDTTTGGEEP